MELKREYTRSGAYTQNLRHATHAGSVRVVGTLPTSGSHGRLITPDNMPHPYVVAPIPMGESLGQSGSENMRRASMDGSRRGTWNAKSAWATENIWRTFRDSYNR
jgi:hypothetical protein